MAQDEATDPAALALRFAGPEGIATFNKVIREQRPAYLPRVLSELEIRSLFSPTALGKVLYTDSPALESAEIFTGSHLVRLKDMLHQSGRNPLDVISQQLSSGATARFRNLERLLPDLRALGQAMEKTYGGTTTINAYLTAGRKKGFPAHFDNTDVFVLQCLGAKRWTLFEDYTDRQELPLRGVPWNPERYRPTDRGRAHILRVGDLIYLPRGTMHATESAGDTSLHLTISLDSPTVHDCLRQLLEQWAGETLEARRRLIRDPAEATQDLCRIAGEFERWLRRRKAPYDPVPPARDSAGRFDDLVESLRRLDEEK